MEKNVGESWVREGKLLEERKIIEPSGCGWCGIVMCSLPSFGWKIVQQLRQAHVDFHDFLFVFYKSPVAVPVVGVPGSVKLSCNAR